MPRGRHRHSPPLHRLLPPSAIAGVSLVCALGPWVFTDPSPLRGLAAAAAVTAVTGAVVMRRWDTQAGKQVADLTRARASDEWRFEERIAELETDLDESRELRVKLEQRLRSKRAELQGLRNEHAALLRRYATAESERASALEGRRLLEIEAAVPAPALPPAPAPVVEPEPVEEAPAASGLFSPEGTRLFARAGAALARLDGDPPARKSDAPARKDGSSAPEASAPAGEAGARPTTAADQAEAQEAEEGQGKPEAADGHQRAVAAPHTPAGPADGDSTKETRPAPPVRQPGAHFTVPTAVAVVPASAPVRRPTTEGGFDFFGTKKSGADALEAAVQNEDLADVVGQEALDLHKAETEAGFKPADENARAAAGQVIDLTEHDETEQINLQGLRTAAS
ncbi:hypothetical protein [Streptomyces flavalbus]|uniref:Secreted protein n=1 Tax=Streptomyces flavalbus TaxID=2665155 RepID=A0ABW2WD92_9ACTN